MPPAGTSRHLTVRAGQNRFTLDAETVAEVIRAPRVTRMPHGPPALLGVIQTRGIVLPVVSLGRLLGAADPQTAGRVIVLHGTPGIGIAVDAVEALTATGAERDRPSAGQLRLEGGETARWFDLEAALKEHFSGLQRARGSVSHQGQRPAAGATQALPFLGFSLAEQAYALPLEAVVEVMAAPAALSTVPRMESVLLGLMDLRGTVLPVVSLRALLGLAERSGQPGDKVIVIALHGLRIGLLVDRISVVLRAAPDAVSPAPSLFNDGVGEARIVSVLRLPDQRGFVSILTPDTVFADARVARLLAETSEHKENNMSAQTAGAATAAPERFLILDLGGETYGLPLAAVDEVARFPKTLTRLPRAPDYVLGLMSLRGKVIPVVDQRRRFSIEQGGQGRARRIVVVTLGTLQAGFAVDAASRILEVKSSDLMPAPKLSDGGERLFDRVAPSNGGSGGDVVLLMDPKALLARAEADLLRDLTAKAHVRARASKSAPRLKSHPS